jgi:hypothetical protein
MNIIEGVSENIRNNKVPAHRSEIGSLNGAVPELKSKNSHSGEIGQGLKSLASFSNSNVGISQVGGAVAEFSESNRRHNQSNKQGGESNSI